MQLRARTPLLLTLATSVFISFFCPAAMLLGAEPANLPRIQMVLMTPSDVDPPEGHKERLTEIANYTESFLSHWMKHWEYLPQRSNIFDREANGSVVIRYVRGNHSAGSGRYDKPGFMAEVYNKAIPKYAIPRHLHVWWVHVYLGPDRKFSDFRGQGNAARGGSALVAYSTLPGTIDPSHGILEGFHNDYHLKGVVHEFGHALGLPHLGPRFRDGFGNTLMGPNQFEWNRIVKRPEPRACLSQAAAAMLWKHPLFSGSTADRQVIPNVQVDDLHFHFDKPGKRIRITGCVQSSLPAHSIVVADDSTAARSEYWRKAYTGRVAEDGTFQVEINELAPADGVLKIVFSFNNGAITGDGKILGLGGAISRDYRHRDSTFVFDTAPDTDPL